MNMKLLGGFLIASVVVIAVLTWLLVATPAHAPTIESITDASRQHGQGAFLSSFAPVLMYNSSVCGRIG